MELPDEAQAGKEFALQVSLAMETSPSVAAIVSGEKGAQGQLLMTLPATPGQDRWTIEVVVSAPGFAFRNGVNSASIVLPKHGDSTPALFHLRSLPGADGPRRPRIHATFWHRGAYLAKIARSVTIEPATALSAGTVAPGTTAATARGEVTSIDPALRAPDLTLYILEGADGRGEMIVASPYLQTSKHAILVPAGLAAWLDQSYARFVSELARDGDAVLLQDRTIPLLRGFGRDVYRRFAPPAFKEAYWRLHDRLGDRFQTIQIFSNNPQLPWELMRPARADGSAEKDFLSLDHQVARWHVTEDAGQLDRAPQTLVLKELVVIAPGYEGAAALPSQRAEVRKLSGLAGFRSVPGRFADLKALFANFPDGIIHFAGHGAIQTRAGVAEHFVRLEDHDLDLSTFRGMTVRRGARHPFIFFNACDIGQIQRVVNFVDGWAPAALEAGASGYVGGLWTLGDRGAADFAGVFYDEVQRGLRGGSITVAAALQHARRRFYQTGDPTFLAYVYYGDANFRLTSRASSR